MSYEASYALWLSSVILGIICLIVDLAWVARWEALLARIGKLVSAPWIFAKQPDPYMHPLYPRVFLEQLAQAEMPGKAGPTSGNNLSRWWKSLGDRVLRSASPLVAIGHVLSLVFFLFFIFADAVTVANTLVLIGVEGNLPPLLQRLDLAILGGALVSATVGVWVLIEVLGKGEFIAVEDMTAGQKRIFGFLAILIVLFSVLVMLALAGERLVALGMYAASPTTNFLISFTLYGLLAINSSLAAALMFSSAALGIIVILLLIDAVIALVVPVLVFLVDMLWRVVAVILDVIAWLIITPFVALSHGVRRIFRVGRPA
jgi:hypothetical protein